MTETLSVLHETLRLLHKAKGRLLGDGYKPVCNTIIEAIGLVEGEALRLEELIDDDGGDTDPAVISPEELRACCPSLTTEEGDDDYDD